MSEKTADRLTCEACGKDFDCGAQTGKCWCFEVELDKEALGELRENFKSCLCQDCLLSRESEKSQE